MTRTLLFPLLLVTHLAPALGAPAPLLGGEGHGMLVETGGDENITAEAAALEAEAAALEAEATAAVLGGDDHGMLNTPETTLPAQASSPAAAAAAEVQPINLHQIETEPQPPMLGGGGHGQRGQEEEEVKAKVVHLDLVGFELLEPNGTNGTDVGGEPFDWSVTHYINGSTCYLDGDGDGNVAERCFSSRWVRAYALASQFVFFMMVVTIVLQAVAISRKKRELRAVSLQMASILVDSHANGNLHGGDADNVALVLEKVPPAYPSHDVSKLGGGSRYTHSVA